MGWEISIAKSGLKVHKNLSISGSGDSLRAQAAFPDSGAGFDSQHPQGRSQPSVNPVPRELTPALLSLGNRHTRGAHTQIFIHLIAKFLFFKKKKSMLAELWKSFLPQLPRETLKLKARFPKRAH